MVCSRCILTVKAELCKLDINYYSIAMGHITIINKLTQVQQLKLFEALEQHGFELVDEYKNALIEKLKDTIENMEQSTDEDLNTTYSDYISLSVDDNFISLNQLFSEIEGITIEKYIIRHKIQMVKELLLYNNLNLSEIASKMHYSNVTKLSNQFKNITGLTPSNFRQLQYSINDDPYIN